MKKISIDKLNDMVDSSYSLVTIISKRARQIIDGSDILIKTPTNKPVGIAIEEFYDHQFDAIYNYDQFKKEQEEKEAEDLGNSESADSGEGLDNQEDDEQ
nr:DNA-directed RNA polymerase subunit omega [Sedimentibacter sp.]